MVSKYGNFTNEVIGQSYVPVVKILFLGAGNLQVTTNEF